ncbi:MAG TPA: hypothetical protein DEB69_01690 [Candidatus Komeilibacteria bacterium]|nr:hypothetical protein [Candidatus Komeilibacteria bacterium]
MNNSLGRRLSIGGGDYFTVKQNFNTFFMTTTENLTINRILNAVAERKATDVHFVVGNNPIIRINGQLTDLADEEVINPEFLESLINFFAGEDKLEILKKKKEIKFAFNWLDKARFRVYIFKQKGYYSISLKLVPQQVRSLEEIGLAKAVAGFCRSKRGLIFVSGPFNSGRSSTMSAMIDFINKNIGGRIFFFEEPIEQIFINQKSMIEQREVGQDVDSFSQGLASIKDEDVDVVAVSKVDSIESLELILELAESGRLVMAMVDYDSAISCLEGLISDFPQSKKQWAQDVIADYLVSIIVQRLVPTVQGGMVLAVEILIGSSSVKSLIKEGRYGNVESIIQTSRAEGMISLDYSLAELVRTGKIAQAEAIKQAVKPQVLMASLKKQ